MPPEDEPLSRLYRTAVQQLCTQYVPDEDTRSGDPFLTYLDRCYKEEKARLTSILKGGGTETDEIASRNGVFVFAAGLFAYGRLDVAEDLLDCLPSSGAVRNLALALKALLPLPAELEPLREPDLVRSWLRQHKEGLCWSETSGVYVISDDKP